MLQEKNLSWQALLNHNSMGITKCADCYCKESHVLLSETNCLCLLYSLPQKFGFRNVYFYVMAAFKEEFSLTKTVSTVNSGFTNQSLLFYKICLHCCFKQNVLLAFCYAL